MAKKTLSQLKGTLSLLEKAHIKAKKSNPITIDLAREIADELESAHDLLEQFTDHYASLAKKLEDTQSQVNSLEGYKNRCHDMEKELCILSDRVKDYANRESEIKKQLHAIRQDEENVSELPLDMTARFLKVDAEPRYWEDAMVNDVVDEDGTLIFGKDGDSWKFVLDIVGGVIVDYPIGKNISIHYKVCDAGSYWLLDENKQEIAKYKDHYVPDDFLCHGSCGYGDYIILNISEDGTIKNYERPRINEELWQKIDKTQDADFSKETSLDASP